MAADGLNLTSDPITLVNSVMGHKLIVRSSVRG